MEVNCNIKYYTIILIQNVVCITNTITDKQNYVVFYATRVINKPVCDLSEK